MKLLATLAVILTGCVIPMQPASQQPYGPQPANAGGGDPNAPMSSSQPSQPSSSSNTSQSSAPSAPAGPVSVTIRGECGQTVPVFFGEKPGFSSGTKSSVESNSLSNHSFRPGEVMWVIDEHENGVASVTVRADTHEIDVNCTAISER
jgi:hypothetical protein